MNFKTYFAPKNALFQGFLLYVKIKKYLIREGYLNILVSRNRDSGKAETNIPDTETAFSWLDYHS